MASIRKRGKKYAVIYSYKDNNGVQKQKWISGLRYQEATRLKLEIESSNYRGTFVMPSKLTVKEFIQKWIEVYGRSNWQYATYTTNTNLIRKYILPQIGNIELKS